MGTEPRATDAAATRLLVNVAGLVAREIEAIVGPDYDLPLATKVGARVCDVSVTQVHSQCAVFLTQHSCLHSEYQVQIVDVGRDGDKMKKSTEW